MEHSRLGIASSDGLGVNKVAALVRVGALFFLLVAGVVGISLDCNNANAEAHI
jgi:hypothetical protein